MRENVIFCFIYQIEIWRLLGDSCNNKPGFNIGRYSSYLGYSGKNQTLVMAMDDFAHDWDALFYHPSCSFNGPNRRTVDQGMHDPINYKKLT